jgi:hypothetical protein
MFLPRQLGRAAFNVSRCHLETRASDITRHLPPQWQAQAKSSTMLGNQGLFGSSPVCGRPSVRSVAIVCQTTMQSVDFVHTRAIPKKVASLDDIEIRQALVKLGNLSIHLGGSTSHFGFRQF